MVECKICGMSYNSDEYDFCPYCGENETKESSTGVAEEKVFSAKTNAGSSDQIVKPKKEKTEKQKSSVGLKFLISGLILIAVAAAAFFGLTNLRTSGATVPDQYATIQEAIDAAEDGDEIIVQTGVYRENLDFQGKNIILRSTDPDDPAVVEATVIDGNGRGPVVSFRSGEGDSTMLAGFTITRGGGILISGGSAPIIEKCVIEDNTAEFGAGLFIVDSSPTIRENFIIGNSAYVGGGIFIEESSPRLEDNNIAGNYAEMGSGIAIYSNAEPVINNNIIADNVAARLGGAIFITLNSKPVITGNTIAGNRAEVNGGGFFIEESEPTIENNTINGNAAENGGGMIIVFINNPDYTIANNIFSENFARRAGGALYLAGSSLTMDSNQFTENQSDDLGGAVALYDSTPLFTNNSFENNTASDTGGGGAIWLSADSKLEVSEPDLNRYIGNAPTDIFTE